MGQPRDLDHVALEEAAGVGVGDHDRRHVRAQAGLQVGEVDPAVLGLGDLLDHIADEGRSGRVGAVGGGGDQHALAGVALGLVGPADGQQAAELAVGAGLGRQGHRRHASERLQPMGQLVHQRQGALDGGLGLQGVQVRKARQAGHLLVQARVVLHRARAEGIEGQVDGVVLLAQPHIVTQGFGLGETRQPDRLDADQVAKIGDVADGLRQIDAGLRPAAQFEDQRLVLQQAAAAHQGGGHARLAGLVGGGGLGRTADGLHGHDITRVRAAVRASISAGVVVSVAASSSTSSRPAFGSRRE